MVLAIRHGVLGYEAMGLGRPFKTSRFGVHNYEATRRCWEFPDSSGSAIENLEDETALETLKMEPIPNTPPNADIGTEDFSRRKRGRWLAGLGVALLTGPVWGLLGTVVGMTRAFDALAEDSAAAPETLSQDIRFALVASAVGIAVGLVGAILVLTAFFAAKNREHWFFWWSVVLSAFLCFSSPIVGLPILILFLWRRAEFMKPAIR